MRFLCLVRLRATRFVREAHIRKFTNNHQGRKYFTFFLLSGSFVYFCRSKSICKNQVHAQFPFCFVVIHQFVTWKINKSMFSSGACAIPQCFVWLNNCLYIVKETLPAFFNFFSNHWIITNQKFLYKTKMANTTAAELAKLNKSVEVLTGNLDQMFLLVMGCLIFCEYVFLVLVLLTLVVFSRSRQQYWDS